jgi:hypothetical protein
VAVESCFDLATWIHAAEVVVQRASTAALESYFAGVPCINYSASAEDLNRDILTRKVTVPAQVSIQATGVLELCNVIDRLDHFYVRFQALQQPREVMATKFFQSPEQAAQAMADVIGPLIDRSIGSGVRPVRRMQAWSTQRGQARTHRPPPRDGRAPRFKRRPLLAAEVNSDLVAALGLLGHDFDCRAEFIEKDCFAIRGLHS